MLIDPIVVVASIRGNFSSSVMMCRRCIAVVRMKFLLLCMGMSGLLSVDERIGSQEGDHQFLEATTTFQVGLICSHESLRVIQ